MQSSLSSQLFSFQTRNILWGSSALLSGLSALAIASCMRVESPIQKAGLGVLAASMSLANVAWVRPQYHRANQMSVHIVNAQLQGDRDWQLQAFAPPSERQALPLADIEVMPEDDDFFSHLPDDRVAQLVMLALMDMGIETVFVRSESHPEFDRYILNLPAGCSISKVQKLSVDIMSKAGLDVEPVVSAIPGGCAIDLPKDVEYANPVASDIVDALLKVAGKELKYVETQEGLAFDRYLFIPGRGVKVADIQSKSADLKVHAGLTVEPIIAAVPGSVAIDVAKPDRVFAKYEQYINGRHKQKGLWIPVGVDQITGELRWINLADSNNPHWLIGGMTGSGKTEFLRSVALHLVEYLSKDEINLLLIDTKKAAFNEFKGVPHLIGGTVLTRPIQAAIALIKLVRVVERRQETREAVGAKDLESYNLKTGKSMPRILTIIEEFKDVVDALKMVAPADLEQLQEVISESMGAEIKVGYKKGEMSPRDVLLLAVDRVAQIGRSEGVHLAIATQDPDKKLLDTIIANLPVQIGLKTRSDTESGTLMPNTGAQCHKLLGKGDMYLNAPGQPLQRLQSLYADESYIESVVEASCV